MIIMDSFSSTIAHLRRLPDKHYVDAETLKRKESRKSPPVGGIWVRVSSPQPSTVISAPKRPKPCTFRARTRAVYPPCGAGQAVLLPA